MSFAVYEITRLPNGDVVLRDADEGGEPLLRTPRYPIEGEPESPTDCVIPAGYFDGEVLLRI